MITISEEYLAVYERELRLRLEEQPGWSKHGLRASAKAVANLAVPEARECANVYMRASTGRDAEGLASYEAKVGKEIVDGLRIITTKVFRVTKPEPNKTAPSLPAVADAAAMRLAKQAIVDMAGRAASEAPVNKEDVTHSKSVTRRPTNAQRENLVERYCEWASTHSSLPSDTTLAHFTEWGRNTWAKVREEAQARGFKLETQSKQNYVKVIARPQLVAQKVEPVSDDEALIRRIVAIIRATK